MRKLLLIVMLGLSLQMTPQSNNRMEVAPNLHQIMKVIKKVESKNKSYIISPNGKYIGILQISKICIAEVNNIYGTAYRHHDAFDVGISEDIFLKTMNWGINLFKKKYNKPPTEEQLVRMWNGGVYEGYKKPRTKKYYAEYLKQKKKTLTL